MERPRASEYRGLLSIPSGKDRLGKSLGVKATLYTLEKVCGVRSGIFGFVKGNGKRDRATSRKLGIDNVVEKSRFSPESSGRHRA